MKKCKECNVIKPLNSFNKHTSTKDKLRTRCKPCDKKRYEDKRVRCKDKKKDWNLQYNFNITLEDYNKMFQEQDGKCAICNKHQTEFDKSLAVDHCHETGKVRGLLCRECNTGLGKFKDSTNLLEKAKNYLIKE